MTSPLSVGIVGCGRAARRHVRFLKEDPRVRVTILHDPDRAQAEAVSHDFELSARIVGDEQEALTRPGTDALILCSPTTRHFEQANTALKAGIDVLCEKPLASTFAECAELRRLAETTGRRLGVAYQRRFEPVYRTARRELREFAETYGPVQEIHVRVCERWAQTIEGTWRNDPAFSGGYFADAGSHQIDACWYMTGLTPTQVWAQSESRGKRVAIVTRAVVKLNNGAFLFAHFVGDANHWSERISIHGAKADLVLDNGKEIVRWCDNRMEPIILLEPGSSPVRGFIDAILFGREFEAGSNDACMMAAWTEGVLEASRTGREVLLDDVRSCG